MSARFPDDQRYSKCEPVALVGMDSHRAYDINNDGDVMHATCVCHRHGHSNVLKYHEFITLFFYPF